MPRAAQFLPPLLLVLLASVTHLPALRGGEFTLDDVALIEENPRLEVHSGADLWRLVSGRYWGDDAGGERLWRPVPLVTYAAERRAHGGDPYLSRALNVALHTGCAWLIYALLAGWLPRRASLLASVAFLLHPVHAEVTGGVVGRAELLALGGVLSAVWLHRRLRRARSGWARAGYAVLAALAFGVAFGSKEIALAGPALLALAEFARCPGSRRRRLRAVLGVVGGAAVVHGAARAWRRLRGQGPQPGDLRRRAQLRRGARLVRPYLLYGATLGAYFLARHAALEELVARADARTLGEAGFLSRVLVATLIYLDSWLSLVLPHGTSAHYPFGGVYLEPWAAALDPVPGRLAHEPAWGSALSFAPLAIHALLLGGGACLLAQRRPWGRAIGLGVWGFYLALGPVSHVLIPIGVLRADRLLYTPSAWACVALVAGPAAALARTRRRAALRLTYCALAGLCAWVCCAPLQRNLEAWSNNHLLWYRSHERYPEQPRIQLALGKEYLRARGSYMSREDRLASAEFLFRAAVAASPPGTSLAAKARAALGGLLLERGGVAEATGLFLQASQLDPRSVEASEGLARAFLTEANRAQDPQRRLGWLLRAEKIARQATRFAPRSYALWLTYGTVLSALDGREPDALLAYDHAVTLRANPWEGRFNRARLRAFMGDAPGALADYRAVAEQGLAPRTPVDPRLLEEALNQVARLGEATGDAEAQAWVRRARPALPAVTPR